MKYLKTFRKYESVDSKISLIDKASELIGKELTDKDVIPEIREYIEKFLENGNTDLADQLTDIKKKIEHCEN